MTLPLLKLHLEAFSCPSEVWYNTGMTPHIWLTMVVGLPLQFRKVGRITQMRLVRFVIPSPDQYVKLHDPYGLAALLMSILEQDARG